uniref:Ubiquitin-like domain-containing protein n=1 Tax=Leersia perrieri TaxID=77586 RepID=A0A0D9V7V9_9ORYZ
MSTSTHGAGTGEVIQADLKPVKAEARAASAAVITVTVTSQTFADAYFNIKPSVKLRRLMDMYCGKHSIDPRTVKFVNDEGRFVRADQTAEEVGLKDGGSISLEIDQQGSACVCVKN